MTESAGQLDADQVRELFQELSDWLTARGVRAQLFVVGGAAMALAYQPGRLTRDVDALFVPAAEVRQAAEEISAAHGLEPDWLNDAAKGFLPGPDEHPRTVFESEALLVQVPSPDYLLAMKLHASRDERDLDDAATLFARIGYTTAQQGIALLEHTYPMGQLLPRHRYVIDDVVQRARALGEREVSRADAGAIGPASPPRDDAELRRAPRRRAAHLDSDSWTGPRRDPPSGPPGLSL